MHLPRQSSYIFREYRLLRLLQFLDRERAGQGFRKSLYTGPPVNAQPAHQMAQKLRVRIREDLTVIVKFRFWLRRSQVQDPHDLDPVMLPQHPLIDLLGLRPEGYECCATDRAVEISDQFLGQALGEVEGRYLKPLLADGVDGPGQLQSFLLRPHQVDPENRGIGVTISCGRVIAVLGNQDIIVAPAAV